LTAARKLIALLPVLAGLSGFAIDAPFGRFAPTGDSILLVTGMYLVVDVFSHH
jgi:hypothetical protein